MVNSPVFTIPSHYPSKDPSSNLTITHLANPPSKNSSPPFVFVYPMATTLDFNVPTLILSPHYYFPNLYIFLYFKKKIKVFFLIFTVHKTLQILKQQSGHWVAKLLPSHFASLPWCFCFLLNSTPHQYHILKTSHLPLYRSPLVEMLVNFTIIN